MVQQVSSLRTGVKYKDTPIGKIPVDWEVVRLRDISQRFYNGGTPDTTNKDYWDGNIPWVTGADFKNQKVTRIRRYITHEGVKNSATNVIENRELLVVTRTGVGKLAIAPFRIAISQDITGVILDQEKALPKYIYWYLNYNEDRLRALIQGTSINGLLRGDLESFVVPLPPLHEQKEIGEILTTLDYAIDKTTQVIEKAKELKKGLVQRLLTRGIGHKKFKKTVVGEIPVEWEVKRLFDTSSNEKYGFTGGPFGSDLKEDCYTDHGVRIIQLQNIGDGKFLDNYRIFTSEEKANELRSCNIYPGDIIIAKMADPVARACIIPDIDDRYLMASDGIRLSVNEKEYNVDFILYTINSTYFRKNAERHSTGTTRLRIGLTVLKKLPMAIPPLKEQKKIAGILSMIYNELEKESNHKEQLQLLKKGLMQVLLTGKLRVAV